MRDSWANEMALAQGTTGSVTIDVLDWLGHMAIDIVGEAG